LVTICIITSPHPQDFFPFSSSVSTSRVDNLVPHCFELNILLLYHQAGNMSVHSFDKETKGVLENENVESAVRELASDERALAFTEKEQRRIVRRIDSRLVVTLGCLYFVSLLDRTNLGAASVAGYACSRHCTPV
jgi:hypothetical protein